jgi:hypothetical protein
MRASNNNPAAQLLSTRIVKRTTHPGNTSNSQKQDKMADVADAPLEPRARHITYCGGKPLFLVFVLV